MQELSSNLVQVLLNLGMDATQLDVPHAASLAQLISAQIGEPVRGSNPTNDQYFFNVF